MIAWLRRNNSSLAEIGFCAFVGTGLLVSIVTPENVSRVVELSPAVSDLRWVVIGVVCAGLALVVFRLAANWGPVRANRDVLRWQLSGPAGRRSYLRWRLVGPMIAGLAAGAVVGGATALLMADIALTVVGVCAMVGLVAVLVAFLAQVIEDRSRGAVRPRLHLSPGRLHRSSFAPHDGYAGSVGLALSMMDFSWVEHARITRWMRRSSAPSRRARGSVARRIVVLDLARIRRHPEAVLRAAVIVVVAAVIPVLLTVHWGASLVPAVAAYFVGAAFAGGLRTVSENGSLRRSFGVDDRQLRTPHAVIPGAATSAAALVLAIFWQLGIGGAVVLAVGSVFAVLRRATRPELPYDGAVVTDPLMTGAAIQPSLITAQLRGPFAVLVTAILVAAAV